MFDHGSLIALLGLLAVTAPVLLLCALGLPSLLGRRLSERATATACHAATVAGLLASLAEAGQQTPIVVIATAEPNCYVVIDGYKRIAALQTAGRLFGRQLDRLGNQETLHLELARAQTLLELFEKNPLVQCVLVNDQHAFRRLHDQVGVIQLNSLGDRRRRVRGHGKRTSHRLVIRC